MASMFSKVLYAASVSASIFAAATSYAQDSGDRTIEQFACKDMIRDSGSNREVAIAFLHGYLLGKSGNSKFNLDSLKQETDLFIDRCLDNPNEKALDSMLTVKK